MASVIKRAIIIGGGIAGLCAAIGLRQAGIDVVVYEQTAEPGRVGAGITLWANAIKALRRLGVAAVETAGARLAVGLFRDAGGRVLAQMNTAELARASGAPNVAIHRADLHQALLGALPAGRVWLDAPFVGFEQDEEGVTATFADGRSDRADLLIGADGIHSAVRQQLWPEVKLRYGGYTAWRGVANITEEVAPGVASETWGCGARFGIVRINARQVYWFATANAPEGQVQAAAAEKGWLLGHFGEWHHPVGMLIEATRAEEILHNDIYDFEPMERWHRGRVVLLGDAAHATTPNMGQGACQAMESAVVLARCLTQEGELAVALGAYERERRGRAAWITRQSWRIGRVGQFDKRWLCGLRDFVLRVTPATVLKRQLATAVGYDV